MEVDMTGMFLERLERWLSHVAAVPNMKLNIQYTFEKPGICDSSAGPSRERRRRISGTCWPLSPVEYSSYRLGERYDLKT